jgi:4-amino-4-deoxy-L-arabinose transferase-like glycosyltransferase
LIPKQPAERLFSSLASRKHTKGKKTSMSDVTITAKPQPTHEAGAQQTSAWSPLWQRITLGIVMLISLFMNFYQLGQNGFGNPFYASGIRSMLDNVHNFFFVSYDPGGFVTLDKPPLGFWLQVVSAKIFGFTPFSVYLPQALAGVFSVLILYHLVRRHFGITAGILAALALAISPISVLTNRNNTIDSTLVLTMLLGAWAVLKASETGKLRWLLVCAVMVGLGYNVKAAEVLLVVPAFGLLYILAAPKKIWTRIWHLAIALAVMLVIALSWSVVVDATPASQRPYVGSSQDNSEIGLALGYNGVQRLLGNFFGGGGARNRGATPQATGNGATNTPPTGTGQPTTTGNGTTTGTPGGGGFGGANAGGGFGGAGGMFNTGTAGPLRLFDEPLGGQIVWLLPFAILGMLALAWQRRPRFQEDPAQKSLILWGTWLLTMGIFFSVAGFFHQYYLSAMAPAVCALFGIGVVVMWNDYRRVGWRGWLLPIALIATALEQIHIITSNTAWGIWLIPIIAIACFLSALILVVARLFPRVTTRFTTNERSTRFSLQGVVVLGLIGLMMVPAVWSVIPVLQNTESQLPTAGPSGNGGFGGGGNAAAADTSTNTKLISYLEAHQGNAKYLLAVSSSMQADSIIQATNKPVMAMGGFTGSDPILTTSSLQTLIANGTVRFFLVGSAGSFSPQNIQSIIDDLPANIRERIAEGGFRGGAGGFGGGTGGFGAQSSLTTWVTQHCSTVSANLWKSSSSSTGNTGGGFGAASGNLYDCASVK